MHHLIMRRFLVSLVNYASCIVLSLHQQGQGKSVPLILKYSILTIEKNVTQVTYNITIYYDMHLVINMISYITYQNLQIILKLKFMSCQALFRCCRTRANQFFYQLSLKTFIFLQIIALSKCIWHSKYQFQFVFHCQIKQIFYKQFQNYLLIFCVICFLHTKLSSSVYRVIFNNVTLALSLQNVYLDCITVYIIHIIQFNLRKGILNIMVRYHGIRSLVNMIFHCQY